MAPFACLDFLSEVESGLLGMAKLVSWLEGSETPCWQSLHMVHFLRPALALLGRRFQVFP